MLVNNQRNSSWLLTYNKLGTNSFHYFLKNNVSIPSTFRLLNGSEALITLLAYIYPEYDVYPDVPQES